MGEGKDEKTRESPHVEVQERGEIFFFYRPKVGTDSPHSIDDVQRTYIVLRPESGEKNVEEKQSGDSGKEAKFKDQKEKTNADDEDKAKRSPDVGTESGKEGKEDRGPAKSKGENEEAPGLGTEAGHGLEKVELSKNILLRLIVLGRKSLPDPSKRGRPYWGFVELVTTDPNDIKKALTSEEYETKTRGHRTKPASRPAGEGVYRLLRHDGGTRSRMHTHLVYKLELPGPEKHHEPQEALNLEPEGSYLIQLLNLSLVVEIQIKFVWRLKFWDYKRTSSLLLELVKNPEQGNPSYAGLQNKRKASFPAHLQGQIGSRRFVPLDPPDLLNYEGCEFILIGASDDIEEELGLNLQTENEGEPKCSDLLELFGDFEHDVKAPIRPLVEGEWA